MNKFIAQRIVNRYEQRINASPKKVFPLLCPTMEYKWIQPWNCEMVYSDSGFAEDNCIFKTNFPGDLEAETWITSHYQPNEAIQFIRFNMSMVTRQNIILIDNKDNTTIAIWEQIVTGLNEKGNQFIQQYSDLAYYDEISTLEKMLNHYLETGQILRVMK